jgi:hypothetical protein
VHASRHCSSVAFACEVLHLAQSRAQGRPEEGGDIFDFEVCNSVEGATMTEVPYVEPMLTRGEERII